MTSLPPLPREEFERRLARAIAPAELPPELAGPLHAYYEELRIWAPRVDLIGPGSAAAGVERHFGEALAALPWLPAGPASLLDLGSGAGFPGLVLAAARPDLEVTLVEPRERRRAFLAAAARRIGRKVQISAARVDRRLAGLPPLSDVVTVRALRLEPEIWSALAGRLAPGAVLLSWSGAAPPALPAEFEPERERLLPGSRDRWLRGYRLRGTRERSEEGSRERS